MSEPSVFGLKRLGRFVFVLFGITFLSFFLMYSVSGDAVTLFYERTGTGVSAQIVEERREELGLDKPFAAQYVGWLLRFLKGDMGRSYLSGEKAAILLAERLPVTVLLGALSLGLALLVSFPLAIIGAYQRGRPVDYMIRGICFLGNSLPNFSVALLLILLFSVRLRLVSIMGAGTGGNLILPAVTLAFAMSAKYIRQIRAVVLDELSKDYVLAARVRGIGETVILRKYILPIVRLNIFPLLSSSAGSLLGGTAVVETIFLMNGTGKLAVDAILMQDYPVVQAYVVWMAVIYSVIHLTADLLNYGMDPRIRRKG